VCITESAMSTTAPSSDRKNLRVMDCLPRRSRWREWVRRSDGVREAESEQRVSASLVHTVARQHTSDTIRGWRPVEDQQMMATFSESAARSIQRSCGLCRASEVATAVRIARVSDGALSSRRSALRVPVPRATPRHEWSEAVPGRHGRQRRGGGVRRIPALVLFLRGHRCERREREALMNAPE